VNALVNMSQMTVSQMSIQNTTPSHQQRQHWLSEQALAWSGVPVVTIRPTIFLESFFPLAALGVSAEVASNCLSGAAKQIRLPRLMSLAWLLQSSPTRSRTSAGYMNSRVAVARHAWRRAGLLEALNREVTYVDIAPEGGKRELQKAGVPEHLTQHLVTMGELHRAGRYDRLTDAVERVTGQSPMSVRDFVSLHADEFGGRRENLQMKVASNQT